MTGPVVSARTGNNPAVLFMRPALASGSQVGRSRTRAAGSAVTASAKCQAIAYAMEREADALAQPWRQPAAPTRLALGHFSLNPRDQHGIMRGEP